MASDSYDYKDFIIRHTVADTLRVYTYCAGVEWVTDVDDGLRTVQRIFAATRQEAVINHRKQLRAAGPYIAYFAVQAMGRNVRGHLVVPAVECMGEDLEKNEQAVLLAVCGQVLAFAYEGQTPVTCLTCAGTVPKDPKED